MGFGEKNEFGFRRHFHWWKREDDCLVYSTYIVLSRNLEIQENIETFFPEVEDLIHKS